MNFKDLTTYLHQIRPDERTGWIVGYDAVTGQGVSRQMSPEEIEEAQSWSEPGHKPFSPQALFEELEHYSVRPAFNDANPNNTFLDAPTLAIAKNGRLNTNPPHEQTYYEIVYVLEGSITCAVNNEEIIVPAGAMLLMAADIYHHMYTCGIDDIAVSIYFEKSFLSSRFMQSMSRLPSVGGIYKAKPDYPYLLIDFGVDSQTDHFGRMMLCSYFDPGSHSDQSTELLLLLFLTEADSVLNRTMRRTSEGIESELPRIARYIEVHCADVTLLEVAQRFGYAEDYLSAAIRRRYGVSFTRYRNLHCLQQAAALLCSTNRSVTDIAAEVGLSSLSHFYKLFSAEYGMAPAEYRAKNAVK